MNSYVILLRGINVGGKNKVSMAQLREHLTDIGFMNVSTYIASGNIILSSDKRPIEIANIIEDMLPKKFALNDAIIRALVLDQRQLQSVIDNKPTDFGDFPERYHSDAIFLIDINATDIMPVFKPREGVDAVWAGEGVVYSQRLSAQRTKSRLSVIAASPLYKSLTIRNWNTTTKLLDLMKQQVELK